jgi:hypothetical protein
MLKNITRTFAKRYAPASITHYKKKSIPGQQTLFASTPTISWRLETSKLVELTTALSECNAFGNSVSRKDIWEAFSTTFDVNLSNAEKVLSQMKYRNNTPVRFIQELHDNFLLLMNGK